MDGKQVNTQSEFQIIFSKINDALCEVEAIENENVRDSIRNILSETYELVWEVSESITTAYGALDSVIKGYL